MEKKERSIKVAATRSEHFGETLPFAKITQLPKGRQQLIRDNLVCGPSELHGVADCLPRLRRESLVMRVKLKRRLLYKGHQLFQTVMWSKLIHNRLIFVSEMMHGFVSQHYMRRVTIMMKQI